MTYVRSWILFFRKGMENVWHQQRRAARRLQDLRTGRLVREMLRAHLQVLRTDREMQQTAAQLSRP